MDRAGHNDLFRMVVQHLEMNAINLGQGVEQTGNRRVRVLKTLLHKQRSLFLRWIVAVPGMYISRPPRDVQSDGCLVESQAVFPGLAALVKGERRLDVVRESGYLPFPEQAFQGSPNGAAAHPRIIGFSLLQWRDEGMFPRRALPEKLQYAAIGKTARQFHVVERNQIALSPRSPLRMRTASSMEKTKILPSPIFPVLAAALSARTISSARESGAKISSLTFGSRSTLYSDPRYISAWPFWRPWPRTSETVMPSTPMAMRASFTSPSL